jgi:hypothetical protein
MTMHDAFATIVGSVGVGLLLVAYFLSLMKKLSQGSQLYALLNTLGAGLACYSSYLIGFAPFVLLEGTWFVVSLVALIGSSKSARKQAA